MDQALDRRMADFRTWMEQQNYRASTIDQTIAHSRAIEVSFGMGSADIPKYCFASARRLLVYLSATNANDSLRRYLVEHGVTPVSGVLREKPKVRKYEARSFDAEDFDALQDALFESDDPRDRVLEVMCIAGLRVGDALRTKREAIGDALKTGVLQLERKGGTVVPLAIGVPESWERLYELMQAADAPTVAALLSPDHASPRAGHGPYAQIDRRLKHWQRKLDIVGRVHTHKMRRTLATRVYAETKDVVLVQQALNNGPAATMKYLDESRTDAVAAIQQKLRGVRTHKKAG